MDAKRGVILGAGMAGLGAWMADPSLDIFEAKGNAGGLCGGFDVKDFHFDNAVHLSFTKNKVVKNLFSMTEHYIHHPIPRSWYHERWLKHPAQNNLFPLSAEEKIKVIKSFLERKDNIEATNFMEWNKSRYGEYLWKHMFEPYNKKYWCIPLDELGVDWIGNRIYQPTIDEILYGSYTDETPNTYYAPEMRYPKKGGYYAFIAPIVEQAKQGGKIHFYKKAVKIDTEAKTIWFADKSMQNYNRLFSSLPIPEIVQIIEGFPKELIENSKRLENTGVVLVSIGLKRCYLNQMWFYIYDSDIYAARAYMPSEKSQQNVPEGYASIQFEIYFSKGNKPPKKEECVKNCWYALEKLKIAKKEDIVFTDYRVMPYGNVICKTETSEIASEIVSKLYEYDIFSIGRFGLWEYLWSDQAFLSGYNEAKKEKK